MIISILLIIATFILPVKSYAVSFATDKIEFYEKNRRITENVVLIEYDGHIEICENGRYSFGQQFTQTPKLHRLKEPLKNFEDWQKEYLTKRSVCLKGAKGKKTEGIDECGSDEAPVLIYEKHKKEQVKDALYSKTIILPALDDHSVYHVDPNMPMGGMIGTHRCFKVDLKTSHVVKCSK